MSTTEQTETTSTVTTSATLEGGQVRLALTGPRAALAAVAADGLDLVDQGWNLLWEAGQAPEGSRYDLSTDVIADAAETALVVFEDLTTQATAVDADSQHVGPDDLTPGLATEPVAALSASAGEGAAGVVEDGGEAEVSCELLATLKVGGLRGDHGEALEVMAEEAARVQARHCPTPPAAEGCPAGSPGAAAGAVPTDAAAEVRSDALAVIRALAAAVKGAESALATLAAP